MMTLSTFMEWANAEFGGCELGDLRRTKRLVKIAVGLLENVGCAISSSCGRIGAQLVSRFFDQEEVTLESVLKSHTEQTALRCEETGLVLAVQDTTFLNFTSHESLADELGPIGSSSESRGLLMHSILAVTPHKTPLGLLGMSVWARDPEDFGSKAKRRSREVVDKESQKWLDGVTQAESATPESQPLLVVGDRESDIFALFVAPRRPNTDLLVRLGQNRAVEDDDVSLVMDAIESAPILGRYNLRVPRRGKRPARDAELAVQARKVKIKPPRHRTKDIPNEPVEMYVVRTRELEPPDGVEPLDWILLTTLVVDDYSSARKVIDFYSVRWVIEDFHRVLKDGCKVEKLQFETLDRLKPAIAVLSVVACRVLHLARVVREEPDVPASAVCAETERMVMEKWMKMKGEKSPTLRTAGEFVRAVAILGGFMGRKCDGAPGAKTLWQGLRRLEDLIEGYKLAVLLRG